MTLSSQKFEIQPTLINLHPNEYRQEFHYNAFSVKLDRCVGSCNTLNDLSKKVCILNKTEDLNLSVFNMFTGINELKTLTKHISRECQCKFDGTKCKLNQWWNNDKCWCECKKIHVCEKDYVRNPAICNCENGKFLASIMDDSTIISDKDIKSYDEEIKAIPTNIYFYIFLAFLSITITLLIAGGIFCYLIKYWAELYYHFMAQMIN